MKKLTVNDLIESVKHEDAQENLTRFFLEAAAMHYLYESDELITLHEAADILSYLISGDFVAKMLNSDVVSLIFTNVLAQKIYKDEEAKNPNASVTLLTYKAKCRFIPYYLYLIFTCAAPLVYEPLKCVNT